MGDPGDSTDAEQLFAAFRKQEAEWRAKGLYQYLTDEEKAAREEEYRQIQAFQVMENDVENIEGGVEITKTCDKLVALATNEWHLRQVAEMSQKHTKNLWEKNGDLLNTYEDQYNQFLPALKSRWVSLEAALVERQKEAEEKRTLTEEETTLLALTLDEEYLKSAFLRLQGYAPTEEDEAACNVHAMDVFKKMKWEATFTLLRGKAMEELIVMHEDIDRARSQIRGRTRSPAELQEFVNTPGFQQKYTQQSMRQKIDEIARRPLDFVKPNRDPILPSQTAPLAKDPTPEECKILWHIVDCETLSTHAKHYSVARPSEDLMRQKRVKDMPPKAQEKWMREWEDNRDSLLSELNNLLASLKSKFADEGTFRGHKEELSRFNTHPLFKAQESALSKASEISAVTAALEKLINGDGTATPSPPRASPTTTPQSFGPAHYEKLSFLLSAEAALGHLTSMVNLNFKSVYAGKTMDEKVRLATLRVWSLTTSSTLKTLKAIQNDMDSRTKTLSAEEKNWLLLFRDDKDFLTYHNEQALTQQLCDTGKTVTEILEGNVVCNPLPAEGRAPATASNRGEDHKMLAKLLHAETVTALSERVMQLMYGQVFSDSVASLGQQQKRDLYLKWTKCKSKVIKDLIQLRDATKENISEEERKRLTVYKDDPDFIAYNNGNETTQLLAGIENTIADLSEGTTFLPKDLPSAPEANQSVTEHTATEPSQMSRDAPPGPQDANLSTSSNQAEPTTRKAPATTAKHTVTDNKVEVLMKEDYEGLLMLYLKREFDILRTRLMTFLPTPTASNDPEEENEYVSKWNEEKERLLEHIETTMALFDEQISKKHSASYYQSKLRHINDVDFTNYREQHILTSIYWWYRGCMCVLSKTNVNIRWPENFFNIIASLHSRDHLKSYEEKLKVTEPSADIKVHYKFDDMNQEEQEHFLSQWKDNLAMLSTELKTISESIAKTTADLPCIQILEDFVQKGQTHQLFDMYVKTDPLYKSVSGLGELIEEFLLHFDTFMSPIVLATVVDFLEYNLIQRYYQQILTTLPTQQCYNRESFYIMPVEDQIRWIDHWRDSIQPELDEIRTLQDQNVPNLEDVPREELQRINKLMGMQSVIKLHFKNTHLPVLERALASVTEKSKHYFCPVLLANAVLSSEDYLLLCVIMDLELMHAHLEDFTKETLAGESTIHPSAQEEQEWERKKSDYLKQYEIQVEKLESQLQQLCTTEDLTFVKRRLHRFRAQIKFQEQHERDPQHKLAVNLSEETKKNLITLREEILSGYLCPICAKQQLLRNDLQLLEQVYNEMAQTKDPSAQCKLLNGFEDMSGEERRKWKEEWYKSLQEVLKEMCHLRCQLETEHKQASEIRCPSAQVHSNLHRDAKFSQYYKAHSTISKISHLYHRAKQIQHQHQLGLQSAGRTMTDTELLHLKLLVEMEVLGEVKSNLNRNISPTVTYLESLSISQVEEPVVVKCWKNHVENKLLYISEAFSTLQSILERHLLENYPVSVYIDNLMLQRQSQDFITYHKEDSINLNSAWLLESIIKPSLADLNLTLTEYQSPDANYSTSSSVHSDTTPDYWYPSVSPTAQNLISTLEGITPLESSSPGLGSYEFETITSYLNFLKTQEYIKNFGIERMFVETLNNLNQQNLSESDPEYKWLKEKHTSHAKDRYNKVKRLRDCLKPTYEIVFSGRGENLIVGEKNWGPYIDYMKTNTAAMNRYEDHPVTKEVNEVISAPYTHYTKSDYDVVIGSLQYKELERLTDQSPGGNSKISSLKASLKSKHAEYERRKSNLISLLHQKGFFETYTEDKDTKWIRKEAESQKKVTTHNEEAKYFDEKKKSAYLDCIIAYMLAKLKQRYDQETHTPDEVFMKKTRQGVTLPKDLYKIRKRFMDHRSSIANLIGDLSSQFSTSSMQNYIITQSAEDIEAMESHWTYLSVTFGQCRWNPYNSVVKVFHLDGVPMFESPTAMLTSTDGNRVARTLHESMSPEDQQEIINVQNFLILQAIRQKNKLEGEEDLQLVDMMIPFEPSYLKVHSDDRLAKIAESFFSLAHSKNDTTRCAHNATVPDNIKQVMDTYNVTLTDLDLHIRHRNSAGSIEQRVMEDIVAQECLEELKDYYNKSEKKPTKFAKMKSGYNNKSQLAQALWKENWKSTREQLYEAAKQHLEAHLSPWQTDHQLEFIKKLRQQNMTVIEVLKYHPINEHFLTFLRFIANSQEVEQKIDNKIHMAKQAFYFNVPPAGAGAGHFECTKEALPFVNFRYKSQHPIPEDVLVLFNEDQKAEYKRLLAYARLQDREKPLRQELIEARRREAERLAECAQRRDNVKKFFEKEMTSKDWKVAQDAKSFQLAALYLQECEKVIHTRNITIPGFFILNNSQGSVYNSDIEKEMHKLRNIMEEKEVAWSSVMANRFIKKKYSQNMIMKEEIQPNYLESLVSKPTLVFPPKDPLCSP